MQLNADGVAVTNEEETVATAETEVRARRFEFVHIAFAVMKVACNTGNVAQRVVRLLLRIRTTLSRPTRLSF
jgi:hypothetical protein